MSKLAIVILNYNGRVHLKQFLPSIIKYSSGYEIVVADNGSTDDSIKVLLDQFPDVKIIELGQNYGFCGGYNRALDQLDADYFAIINSDVEVTKNWIEPMLHLFDKDNEIAAIQPKLLDFNNKNKFEYAGGAGGFIDKYGYPFCRGRIFETIETDDGQYNDTREIFWATGACFIIRSDLFKKYGGFDEDFFAHMEEIDLCWRMKKDGYKIFHCGESKVYHVGGGTLTYANPRKTYLNFRNSLIVLIKNLPGKELIWKLPFRWLIDYVAFFKFIITGDIRDGIMILKAHIYVIQNFFLAYRKRKFKLNQQFNSAGIYPKFLLFSYHVAGVRKFKDLKI